MRSYPRNSPEAAARLVALVLICDGHVCRSEIEALRSLEGERALGLAPGQFGAVVHTLCEDLLASAQASGAHFGSVDESTLLSLLREVEDPSLQRTVLTLADAAARSDRHVADAETLVMAAARQLWQLEEPTDGPGPPAAEAAASRPPVERVDWMGLRAA